MPEAQCSPLCSRRPSLLLDDSPCPLGTPGVVDFGCSAGAHAGDLSFRWPRIGKQRHRSCPPSALSGDHCIALRTSWLHCCGSRDARLRQASGTEFLILESDPAPGSAATKPAAIRRDVASVLVRFMKEAVPRTPPRHPLSSVRVGMGRISIVHASGV